MRIEIIFIYNLFLVKIITSLEIDVTKRYLDLVRRDFIS